jgi:hypothetical protein
VIKNPKIVIPRIYKINERQEIGTESQNPDVKSISLHNGRIDGKFT